MRSHIINSTLASLSIFILVSAVAGQDIQSTNGLSPAAATSSQGQTPMPTPSPSPDDYVFPTSEERTKHYVRSLVGPLALGRMAVSAGINQWRDHPAEWGQGAEGYGKRFASQLGRNTIRQTVQFGLSEALQLDTSFERSKRTGLGPRLKDALMQNVTSRTRDGRRVVSIPRLAAAYASPMIAYHTWYPDRYSSKDALRSGSVSIATGFGLNVVREFLFNW